jgi:hypothetical protein
MFLINGDRGDLMRVIREIFLSSYFFVKFFA